MKKPVRKGYADGGKVDSPSERYVAARNAEASAIYNELSPALQKRAKEDQTLFPGGKLSSSGRDLELARADYPGFSKGGKVKKTVPKKAARKR